MARKAIVAAGGLVLNVIEVDDTFAYPLNPGETLVDAGQAGGPGDTYNDGVFTDPNPEA